MRSTEARVRTHRKVAGRLIVAALLATIAGCVHMPAPVYQPAIDTTELLMQRHASGFDVGTFDSAPGVPNRRLGIRGSSLRGGVDGTFSTYLQEALTAELKAAGRYDPQSATRISGTLLRNELTGGTRTGKAVLAARFVLEREGQVVLQRTYEIEHRWDSSFIGAIAIPEAMGNYPAAVQKLIAAVMADPDFQRATAGDP